MKALVANGSGAMFDRIARRYDLLNRILSVGLDRRWRRKAVAALAPQPGERILDLATGTADVALAVLAAQPEATVVGLDPSNEMLAVGAEKARALGVTGKITFVPGDAQELPFPDASFDGITMAFGIRNVPDRALALSEMARVLRPGGRAVILELSEPRNPLARFHVHKVVPLLGALLSGASEYRYLEKSIAAFPPPESFGSLMAVRGLPVEKLSRLTFGVACLFVGRKP
jgi:demethylmenaquinone methyltransferase/2-methoxy-6-polyprenyl-1,4-benzoquinol methylase